MIKIYYLTTCPHSMSAVNTLKKNNIKYEPIISDKKKDKVNKNNDKLTNGYTTFPQIFWKNHFVGGNDSLQQILSSLKNKKILKDKWDNEVDISSKSN